MGNNAMVTGTSTSNTAFTTEGNVLQRLAGIENSGEMYLSIKDVAQRYGVSVATIFVWVNKNILPRQIKFGRCSRWRLTDLVENEQRLPQGPYGGQEVSARKWRKRDVERSGEPVTANDLTPRPEEDICQANVGSPIIASEV